MISACSVAPSATQHAEIAQSNRSGWSLLIRANNGWKLNQPAKWVPTCPAVCLAIAGSISAFSALKARETRGLTFAEIDAFA